MGSSEILDSCRVPAGRSNFSQTCSLLSRYLKKGSLGDIGLTFAHKPDPMGAPTETMNLLPMIEKSGSRDTNSPPGAADETQNKADLSDAKATAQMTIFYGGKVIVFNDFPANKAEEIMTLATKASAAVPSLDRPGPPPLDSDLPIARKNSLARFLEKRKDRVTVNAPYPVKAPAPAPALKLVKTEEWLGPSPKRTFQIQRH